MRSRIKERSTGSLERSSSKLTDMFGGSNSKNVPVTPTKKLAKNYLGLDNLSGKKSVGGERARPRVLHKHRRTRSQPFIHPAQVSRAMSSYKRRKNFIMSPASASSKKHLTTGNSTNKSSHSGLGKGRKQAQFQDPSNQN
jgi:hypothetical protein